MIQAVRRLPIEAGGQLPAVAVTAHASPREHDQALAAGYNWHLAKPIDFDELVASVARGLSLSQPR